MTVKIALISHGYPPLAWGGIEAHCYNLAHQLARKGVQVTVICGARRPSHTIEEDGVEVCRLPFLLVDFPPNFVWFQAQNSRRFQKLLKTVDLVHSEQTSGTICALLKRRMDFPWLVSFHNSWARLQLRAAISSSGTFDKGEFTKYVLGFPVFRTLTQLELSFSDLGTACSKTLAAEFQSEYHKSKKLRVIPNGIDPPFFEAMRDKQEGVEASNLSLFFSGRLYKIKGIDYLLRAMTLLKKQYPGLELKIFGRGPLRRTIDEFVANEGLRPNVKVEGYVPYLSHTLVSELARSTVAVFPSIYEAQSIAVLEAMACSKPVVAFDLPFSRELLRDGVTGVLARPLDERDLAECISRLLESEELRNTIGKNAQEYVKSHHDWNKIVNEYMKVYEDLLNSNP